MRWLDVSSKTVRLGKGLEALIPKTLMASGRTLSQLPISEVVPNPFQPRTVFDEEALQSLAQSIKTFGVNQPILVRKVEDRYELVAGERRLRAAALAGLDFIPSVVKSFSDEEALQFALVENLQRENLDPIETALGVKRLIDEFDMTHQAVSEVLGMGRSSVSNFLRLLSLPEEVQQAVQAGKISMGHARGLLALESPEMQVEVFHKILAESMSVRQVERVVAQRSSDKVEVGPSKQMSLFSQMEERIQERFQAKCKVTGGRDKGRIVLYYKSQDELGAIFDRLTG